MSVQIKPDNLKKVARLTAQVKDIQVPKSKSSPWNGLHRLQAFDDQLRLLTTDGSTFLNWKVTTEASFNDNFDVVLNAGQFNEVALHLKDCPLQISHLDGVLSLVQEQRHMRMKVHPPVSYPNPDQPSNSPDSDPVTWNYNSLALAESLEFITPFIDDENPNPNRSVATLRANGQLDAGSGKTFGRVQGLDTIPVGLNFKRSTAERVAAFLKQVGPFVEITVCGESYMFRCLKGGHTLVVAGECHSFVDDSVQLANAEYESLKFDKDTLVASLRFLSVVVSGEGKPVGVRTRGRDEVASMRISSGGPVEAEESVDEIQVIRTFIAPEDIKNDQDEPTTDHVRDTNLKLRSTTLREIMAGMKGKFLNLKIYYPKFNLLRIEEEKHEGKPTRSALMTFSPDEGQNQNPSEDVKTDSQHVEAAGSNAEALQAEEVNSESQQAETVSTSLVIDRQDAEKAEPSSEPRSLVGATTSSQATRNGVDSRSETGPQR